MAKEVTSFPELTTTERNALTGVPTGTVILNTTSNQFEVWSGAVWAPQTGGGGGATTALDNLAAVAINTDLIFGTGITGLLKTKNAATTTNFTLKTGDDSAGGGSGFLFLESGTSATGSSGAVLIRSGISGAQSGNVIIQSNTTALNINTGNCDFKTGNTTGTGISGQVNLLTGSTVNAASGLLTITTGGTSGTGVSGVTTLKTGNANGTANSGAVLITSGSTSGTPNTALSGTLTLNTGVTSNGASGLISLVSGNATGSGNSGGITLQTGTSSSGTRGTIILHAPTISTTGSITTTSDTSFNIGASSFAFANIYSGVFQATSNGKVRFLDTLTSEIFRIALNDADTTPSGETTPGSSIWMTTQTGALSRSGIYVYTKNNATADAVSTGELHLETGNKTAGTGNSGGIILQTGTSSGGARGSITLDSATNILLNSSVITIGQFYNGIIKTFDDTASASMTVRSGNSSAGASGTLLLTTGAPTTNSGGVVLSSANTTGGNSGTVQIKTGTASGTRGNITLDAAAVVTSTNIVPNTLNTRSVGTFAIPFNTMATTILLVGDQAGGSGINLYEGTNSGNQALNIYNSQAAQTLPSGGTTNAGIRCLLSNDKFGIFTVNNGTTINIETKNNGAGASADIVIQTGTATTTKGRAVLADTHLRSTQTSVPTATVDANAGTGATSAVSNATDIAGVLQLVLGSAAWAAGSQTKVNFNIAYGVAPIVVLTPRNAAAATSLTVDQLYVTSTTTDFTVNFVNAAAASATLEWFYHVIETQ